MASRWEQRDTAAYVVSTLNLLRPSTSTLTHRLEQAAHMARFAVYADTAQPDLYFIRVQDRAGRTDCVFAYRMGWLRPQAVTATPLFFRARRVRTGLIAEYRHDALRLVRAFRSFVPL